MTEPGSPTAPATKRARADGWLGVVSWIGGERTEEWHWIERLQTRPYAACGGPQAVGIGPRDEPPADADVCSICRATADEVMAQAASQTA